jgi:hypothetical protein
MAGMDAIDFLRSGDVLVVTRIDRLARSIGDLQDIVRAVKSWASDGSAGPQTCRAGRRQVFPELARAAWFGMVDAHEKLLKGQAIFLTRLLEALANRKP